mmetsp:Transcript_8507/g.14102  ORF Transcript_8507/g.14102 Transcript_8507/m.14102 type:complete len:357 (+) Transcript_8507:31-1101(+)
MHTVDVMTSSPVSHTTRIRMVSSTSSTTRSTTNRRSTFFRFLVGALLLLNTSTTAAALTLSPLQSLALGSRLASIQQAVRQEITSSANRSTTAATPTINDDLFTFLKNNNKHPTIVFPGSGGPDVLTDELQQAINNDAAQTSSSSCIVWDWQHHRGTIATAAFDGEAVGEALAEATIRALQLEDSSSSSNNDNSKQQQLTSIHIVGISVGAFCANAMASALYDHFQHKDGNNNAHRPHIQLTLLDPFCTRGLVGVGYGATHFGIKADYAEHYLNTDDPVPSTNNALPHCYCIDITQAPQRRTFVLPEGETTMHCWPVAYMARHVVGGSGVGGSSNNNGVLPTHDESRPRGAVNVIR